jgi:hypothetical protein
VEFERFFHEVCLIPTAALDGRNLKWIKVNETKGCHLMCVGAGSNSRPDRQIKSAHGTTLPVALPASTIGSPPHYFAVFVQKSVIVFEITQMEKRHHKLKDFAIHALPQTITISGGCFYVGCMSGFRIWDLVDNMQNCKFELLIQP